MCWLPLLVGIIGLPVLGYIAAYKFPGGANLSARLGEKATTALAAGGFTWAAVSMNGQTATVTGTAPSVEAEQAALTAVRQAVSAGGPLMGGITQVIDNVDVVAAPAAPSFKWLAERVGPEGVRLSGAVPTDADKLAIVAAASPLFAGGVDDQMTVDAGLSPGSWLDGIRVGLPHFAKFGSGKFGFDGTGFGISGEATDSTLDFFREDLSAIPGMTFDVADVKLVAPKVAELEGVDFSGANQDAACQEGFGRVMAENKIQFQPSSAIISRESGATLDKLLVVARQCTTFSIEVQGHTDSDGGAEANRRLSQERAAAVVGYLAGKEFPTDRLTAVGFGEDSPVASNRTAAGKAENRRIEFVVRNEGGQ
jgi:OOP family OmpA-OmpF porin